jgi:hypothetical protein
MEQYQNKIAIERGRTPLSITRIIPTYSPTGTDRVGS